MFFLNLPSGARCAGRDGKAAEPVHAGPPVGNHLIAVSEPCRRSARGEIRDPKPDGASLEPLKGQDCRSRARRGPSEISIPWDPSPGPAGSMGCRRERQRIPKPSGARESRARKGSVETAVSRGPSPWPAGSTGCRRLRMRYESKGVEALTCTHLSVEHTLALPSWRRPPPRRGKGNVERTQAQRSSSCKAWPRPGRHRRGSNPGSSVADISHERAREPEGSHGETQEWHHPRGRPRRSVHSEASLLTLRPDPLRAAQAAGKRLKTVSFLTDKLKQATNRLARAIPEEWLIDLTLGA